MRRRAAAVVVAAVALAAALAPAPARAAGSVTVLSAGDVDFVDPGATFYTYGFMVQEALHRMLYRQGPGTDLVPDLAVGAPEVLDGGRTVVVRLRGGVRYSPPVGREVVARDVEYAIERTFRSSVLNGYSSAFLRDVVGVPRASARRHRDIPGVSAPDDRTLVLSFRRPVAATVVPTLTYPYTAPVPREYAAQFDRRRVSTYGRPRSTAFTGPYRLSSYRVNRSMRLDRNPSWDRGTDPTRAADLDAIAIDAGNVNLSSAFGRIAAGSALISGDGGPTPGLLRRLRANRPEQVTAVPSRGTRWVVLNAGSRALRRRSVRRAIAVGLDKTRLRATRGGALSGDVATHLIPPGVTGFDQAGGFAGPGGPLASPTADVRAARRALRRQGARRRALRVVADRDQPDRATALEARRQLRALGFRVRLRLVSREALFTRYCTRRRPFDVMVGYGWLADTPDAWSMLALPFGREDSVNNCGRVRSRGIARAITAAAALPAGPERDAAWAAIDRAVLDHAVAVPYVWDVDNVVRSADVRGSISGLTRLWDLSSLSLAGAG